MDKVLKFLNICLIFFILIFSNLQTNAESQETNLQQNDNNTVERTRYAEKHRDLLKLYNNLNCFRNGDEDLKNLSNSFNPLDNLDLYPNPDAVQYYFQNVSQGNYLGRFEPFTNAPAPLDQMIKLFEIFLAIQGDWDLWYKTAAYAVSRVNTAHFMWATSTLLSSTINFPPTFEILPHMFAPKSILRKANGDPDDSVDDNDPEDILNYFKHDPTMNSFHTAWHVDFPFWWLPEKYNILKGRKGELFVYAHHNILNRYKAERLSNKMREVQSLDFDQQIQEGDVPDVLNVNYKEFPSRKPNSIIHDVPGTVVQTLKTWESRFTEGIEQGYFLDGNRTQIEIRNSRGANILGAAIEASSQSLNGEYYGNLHNSIHRVMARISDPIGTLGLPSGVLAHSETAVRDPVFFRIHKVIDDFYQAEQSKLNYTSDDLKFPSVNVTSVGIISHKNTKSSLFYPTVPILTTFFENFTFDISNALKSCDAVNSGNDYNATVLRLNHNPFQYVITAFSKESRKTHGIMRMFMSPYYGYDGKPFSKDDLYWNMIEMDRFPITLKQGVNVFRRKSYHSSVTVPDRPGFKQMIKDANEVLSNTGRSRHRHRATNCGFPLNLLVPRGSEEGMRFKMLVMITEGHYDERKHPNIPICGNPTGKYPDHKPMGFPFDRKLSFGCFEPGVHQNFQFLDVIVQHNGLNLS